jgi:hypothetical protein
MHLGNIRSETVFGSQQFIHLLRASGRLGRMLHNGVDIVLFQTDTGERISAHFIDSALPLYEIRNVLADNASRGIATLYFLWADMMLPSDGQIYTAQDWMEGLFTLYGGSIYAYEFIEREIFLFPVHFRGEGPRRLAEFGTTVQFSRLHTRRVSTHLPGLHGEWLVADFGGVSGHAHDDLKVRAFDARLGEDYALFGLEPGATASEVKAAFRVLAHRLHPDHNLGGDTTARMAQINAAYDRILRTFPDR